MPTAKTAFHIASNFSKPCIKCPCPDNRLASLSTYQYFNNTGGKYHCPFYPHTDESGKAKASYGQVIISSNTIYYANTSARSPSLTVLSLAWPDSFFFYVNGQAYFMWEGKI